MWPRAVSVEFESRGRSLVILGTANINVELGDWEMFFILIREACRKARKLIRQDFNYQDID